MDKKKSNLEYTKKKIYGTAKAIGKQQDKRFSIVFFIDFARLYQEK